MAKTSENFNKIFSHLPTLFFAVTEQNVSEAAKRLRVKEPTASYHLSSLERVLGWPLSYSSGSKRFVPTPLAKKITDACKPLISFLESIRYDKRSEGVARIGITDPLAKQFEKTLSELERRHPEMLFLVSLNSGGINLRRILTGSLDLCVVGSLRFRESERLRAQEFIVYPFFVDELVLIASKENPYLRSNAKYISIKRCFQLPFIIRLDDSATRREIERLFLENGLPPLPRNVFSTARDIDEVVNGVESSSAVSIVSKLQAMNRAKSRSIKILQLQGKHRYRNFYIVSRRNMLHIAKELVELMRPLQEKV